MKIAHTADIHYSVKHLKWVRRAMDHFIVTAIGERCDAAVLAGDIFDSAINAHDPAFHAAIEDVSRLADVMPVVIVYGTLSHDYPGSLEVFRRIRGRYVVFVADRPTFIAISAGDNVGGAFFCLPGLNKALPDVADLGPAEWVRRTLSTAAPRLLKYREQSVPTALITHGTVTGCVTESNHAMISPDHEFSLETLALSEADAVLLGHIHKHQHWRSKKQVVAYPGSLARLVHGHMDPVGFLIWDIKPSNASFMFRESPARQLIDIEFVGAPDFEELRRIAADQCGPDDAIRLRYSIDEEHAGSVDKAAIRRLFSGCDEIKIEARVNPVQRVRAEGIATATTLHAKLKHWADTTGSMGAFEALAARLDALQTRSDEDILSGTEQ